MSSSQREQSGTAIRGVLGFAAEMYERGASLAIAGILVYSGLVHWTNPYYFLSSIHEYRLVGPYLAEVAAACLPFFQLVVGVCLFGRLMPSGAFLASALLFGAFTLAQGSALARGLNIGCGCFGAAHETPVSGYSVALVATCCAASLAACACRIFAERRCAAAASTATAKSRSGFTVVELLVVIAIVGILVALLLPAVMAARESARRVQCQHHLKQLGLAAQAHHDAHGHLPTGGWGFRWVGDADRGFGEAQPGGWVYNILPFLEQEALRATNSHPDPAAKRAATGRMVTVPLALFHCPSRRRAELYPYTEQRFGLANCDNPPHAAKSDYAINAGDVPRSGGQGPDSTANGDLAAYAWPDFSTVSGVSFVRSLVSLSQVIDGASQTCFAGEKHLNRYVYTAGSSLGDDQTMCLGDDADIRRWLATPPRSDVHVTDPNAFGGPHAAGAYFVFCDGSVRLVAFSTDAAVSRRLGNRQDGEVASY